MKKLFAHRVIVLICMLSLITITTYSYATSSTAQKIADAFVKTTTYIDTVCTSPKFTLLAPVRDKITQLLTNKKYSAYKNFLTDIVEYIDQIIP